MRAAAKWLQVPKQLRRALLRRWQSKSALAPATMLLTGGETAAAVLEALGVKMVQVRGEAAPGLAWFEIPAADGLMIACISKSGGFGNDTLVKALHEKRGIPCGGNIVIITRATDDKKTMDKTSDASLLGEQTKVRDKTRPAPLADRVYEQLAARIASGEFRPNTKLPPENDLALMVGVSRPILRTALGRLKSEGMIVSRQGAGSFVRDRAATTLGFSPVETIADIQRCYEFRLTIEPDAAFAAANRRNETSLRKMESALELLLDATRHQRHREDVDFSFHLAVTEAATTISSQRCKP
jgi:DNA-binding transcriptional regulator YhcF (GntR family)